MYIFKSWILFLYFSCVKQHTFSNIPQSETDNKFCGMRNEKNQRKREREHKHWRNLCANRQKKFLKKRPRQFEWRAFQLNYYTRVIPDNTHTHILSHILKKSEAEWIENLQCLNCPHIQTIQPRLIKFTTRRRHWPFQRHNRDH